MANNQKQCFIESSSLKKTLFFVGKRPHAVWDPDIREKNLNFLRNFDIHYFEYLANINSAQINTEHAQQAATALRISYGLALETFISLMGAAIQAPDCVFGWLDRYNQEDLSRIVQGMKGSKRLRTRFRGQLTWESLSNVVHRNLVLVNIKDFSYPRGKDISHRRGKDISHPSSE